MATVSWALTHGIAFLDENGSPSARLDAEVLLAHVLGRRRVDLYAHPGQPLTAEEEAVYRELLERRARAEPVSYLLGCKEFFGLVFLVNCAVMIPRPETEVLVERALEWVRSRGRAEVGIADIGTGSGCVAVALARHLPGARVYAVDLSAQALEVASENVRRHEVKERVFLLQGDLCEPLPGPVDLLVSNPPYTVWEELPVGVTSYEPRVALDGGADGLDAYRRLFLQMPAYLRPGGGVLLEVGDGQAQSVLALAEETFAGVPIRTYPDYSGIERVVEIGPCGGT